MRAKLLLWVKLLCCQLAVLGLCLPVLEIREQSYSIYRIFSDGGCASFFWLLLSDLLVMQAALLAKSRLTAIVCAAWFECVLFQIMAGLWCGAGARLLPHLRSGAWCSIAAFLGLLFCILGQIAAICPLDRDKTKCYHNF